MTQASLAAATRPKPFRFFASANLLSTSTITDAARRAEVIGFDAMMVMDHLGGSLAPIAFLAHVAATTTRLKVGSLVLNNDFRHPVLLAQELAAIDRLSGGRLIVGIGAGWSADDYAMLDLPYSTLAVRAQRMAEAVRLLKHVFSGGQRFVGEYYRFDSESHRFDESSEFLRPRQLPHPPLLVGSGSRPGLTVAAQEADIVGLARRAKANKSSDLGSVTAAATDEKLSWIRAAAGERFPKLEIHTIPAPHGAQVTNTARSYFGRLIDSHRLESGKELSEADLEESPHILVGSVDHLVDKLRWMRHRWGINIVSLQSSDGDDRQFAGIVERLAGQ